MPDYQGSIQLPDGSGESLDTRLTVEEARLIVAAGDAEIGNWSLDELSAERRDGNFHIAVEGEELVLTVADPVGFMEALGIEDRPSKERKSRKKKRRRQEQSPLAEPPTHPVSIPIAPAAFPATKDQPAAQPSWWSRIPLRVKQGGAGVLTLAVLGVFLPGILALLLLLAGMVTLLLGIAARSDGSSTLLPPPFFATTASAVVGIALVLLGVAIIAIT